MSRKLSIHEDAWTTAKDLAQNGPRSRAKRLLTNLVNNPLLPDSIASQAHRLLGTMHLDSEQYTKAQKHFLKAAELQVENAELQYDLGRTFELDPHGCDRRAARRYRAAVRLAPENGLYLASFARSLARIHHDARALAAARQAVSMAPESMNVLTIAIETLRIIGRFSAALKLIEQAHFHIDSSRDLKDLENQVRYDMAAKKQRTSCDRQKRVILPFLTLHDQENNATVRIIRRDRVSLATPHIAMGSR